MKANRRRIGPQTALAFTNHNAETYREVFQVFKDYGQMELGLNKYGIDQKGPINQFLV